MKDILLFDDPQKDEFIEIFKTPPIPPIEFKKIRKRQANAYILANTSPWTDCFAMAEGARKAHEAICEKYGKCIHRHRRVRERCRFDLLEFGLAYCVGEYDGMKKPILKRPPSPRMIRFVLKLQDKILHGGLKHVRWPRGKGNGTKITDRKEGSAE